MIEFVVLDTEFTAWEGSMQRQWSEPWEHREIIQIAAVKVQANSTDVRITETFNELVLPVINSKLSDYVVALTGIEQHTLDDLAVDFPSSLHQFWQFCYEGTLPVVSWGSDALVLQENCRLQSVSMPTFAGGFHDLKAALRAQQVKVENVNSGKLASHLGIDLKGKEHNALHDVRSIVSAIQFWQKNKGFSLAEWFQ